MTAMPPTTGHLQLIQFASLLADTVTVIISTQPHEPYPQERADALRLAIKNRRLDNVSLTHYKETIEQDPTAPGFWKMWRKLMYGFGLRKGDAIVASERYGKKLAEVTGSKFYPYDIDRSINSTKATPIREDTVRHFDRVLTEFQPHLRTTVTVFGAESTGKTTLSRMLSQELNAHTLFEYARPYLENTVNEVTVDSMMDIWKGQKALERQARLNFSDKPFIIQDTDLFSTVGYWQLPHWRDELGECPQDLIDDAHALKSDVYLITRSNIPFEQDPLRYGGDVREATDEYWIDVCERNHLPYYVLESSDLKSRIQESIGIILTAADRKISPMRYDRRDL